MKKKVLPLLLALLLAFSVSAGAALAAPQASVATQTQQKGTLLDILQNNERVVTMLALVEAGAFADNLEQGGPFTVFVPTDEAFDAFDAMTSEPNANLTEILLYHVVRGHYTVDDIRNHETLTSLMGSHINISVQDNSVVLDNNARIVDTSTEASNGIVHFIDTVLIPNIGTQTPTTAPTTTDESVTDAEQDVTVEGAASVLATLEGDGRFTTLINLLNQTGLIDMVRNAADMTLFAPTDDAFAELPPERLEQLTADVSEEGELYHILRYHIVGDSLTLNQIATDRYIPTLEGRPLIVETDEDLAVFLNGNRLSQRGIQASNGIIHVVDQVLNP